MKFEENEDKDNNRSVEEQLRATLFRFLSVHLFRRLEHKLWCLSITFSAFYSVSHLNQSSCNKVDVVAVSSRRRQHKQIIFCDEKNSAIVTEHCERISVMARKTS